jgi:hypothetical protein
MKTRFIFVLALVIWACSSCEPKVDVAKEEAAIKEFFESNKTDYFNGNYQAMSDAWIKEASSVKMWVSEKGINEIKGWENIAASEKKEIQDRTWDPKEMKFEVTYSHFDIQEEYAWVLSKTKWEGAINGENFIGRQSRIAVLKKVDGKWKLSLFAFYALPAAE